jgi:hypothetical protein
MFVQELGRIKDEITKDEKLSKAHPYSCFNQESTMASKGAPPQMPSRTHDRNVMARQKEAADAQLEAPYPAGYTGHVRSGRDCSLTRTYGQKVREARVRGSSDWEAMGMQSSQRTEIIAPTEMVKVATDRLAQGKEQPRRTERTASTAHSSYRPPPADSYLAPKFTTATSVCERDTYGHFRERDVVVPEAPALRPGTKVPDPASGSTKAAAAPRDAASYAATPAAGASSRPDAWVLGRR